MSSSAEQRTAWLYRKYKLSKKIEPVDLARQLGCLILAVEWSGNGWLMQVLIPDERRELLLDMQLEEYKG